MKFVDFLMVTMLILLAAFLVPAIILFWRMVLG